MSSYMAKRDNLVPFIVFDVRIGHQKRTETFLAKDGKFQINSKENKKTENRNKTNLFGQKQEVANNQRATDKTRRAPIPTVRVRNVQNRTRGRSVRNNFLLAHPQTFMRNSTNTNIRFVTFYKMEKFKTFMPFNKILKQIYKRFRRLNATNKQYKQQLLSYCKLKLKSFEFSSCSLSTDGADAKFKFAQRMEVVDF